MYSDIEYDSQLFKYSYIDEWKENICYDYHVHRFPYGLIRNINIITKGTWVIIQFSDKNNISAGIILMQGTGDFIFETSVLPFIYFTYLSCTMPYILTYNFKNDVECLKNIKENNNINIKIDNNIFNMSKGKIEHKINQ